MVSLLLEMGEGIWKTGIERLERGQALVENPSGRYAAPQDLSDSAGLGVRPLLEMQA